METILLPDGTTIQVSSDLSAEDRRKLDQAIRDKFGSPSPSLGAVQQMSGVVPPRKTDVASAGIRSLRPSPRPRREYPEEEGTILGSLWEGIKGIPRGMRQFGLLAQQGIAALRTPDEDTEREKDLRRRLDELYAEVDPRYREANLPQLGMGLGQVAAMVGISFIPFIGKPAAFAGAALMGAGEQAGRLADFEKSTGEDVSSGKELLALAGGLGIGMTEMMPFGKFAKRFRKLLPETGRKAAVSLSKSVERRAGMELLERAAENAGGVVTKAFKTGIVEAGQEAAAGFAQSGVALYLYDDDAMADAGSNAIKEAIIGGETGAVADVLMSMAVGSRRGLRRHSEKRMSDSLKKERDRAVQELREGKISDEEVSDLLNSTDRTRVALREAVMDGSFVADAQIQSEAARLEILTDEEGNVRQPEDLNEVESKRFSDEVRQINNLYRETGYLKSAIEGFRRGRLAPEEGFDTETVLYRGTTEQGATVVQPSFEAGEGVFLTDNPDVAEIFRYPREYGVSLYEKFDEATGEYVEIEPGDLQEVYTKSSNPFTLSVDDAQQFTDDTAYQSRVISEAKEAGYDSIIVPDVMEGVGDVTERGTTHVILDPRNVHVRASEITVEDAALSTVDAGDVLDQIWWRLRPTRVEVEARERSKLEREGLSDSEIDAQVKEVGDAVRQGEDDVLDIQQRLATEEQRVALRELWEATESGDVRLSPSQARVTVDAILQGGVYDMGDVTWKTTSEGAPAVVVDNATRVAEGTPPTEQEVQRASDTANSVLSSVMGFRSLLEINEEIEGLKRDEVTDADRQQLATHIDDIETGKIVDEIIAKKLDVDEELAQKALDVKGITQSLADFVATTLEMDAADVNWEALREGERHAVISRILRTNAQESTARGAERAAIAEAMRLEGRERTREQLLRDSKNIQNAKDRIVRFKESVRAELEGMGKGDTALKIAVAADSIYATIKDIYNDPDIIVDSRAYDTGPSASVQNHGAMVLFNLSQMEARYKEGINTPIETLVKDTAFHEGAHLWYLNDDLTLGEQRSLEGYGKREKVPEAVDKEAYDAGMTWRQWTESKYGKNDPNIVEETSVRVLDALAQGQIPKAKASGFMSKISKDLSARATAIVGAARKSDILSVMKIFEKVQNGELKRRSEAKQQEVGGISSLQVLDRATPKQYQTLKEAAESGSETEVDRAARDIIRSRVEVPKVSLQQSLINEFRARRQIEDTPGSVMPILNKTAIEAGDVSAAALNAYFQFTDGSIPPYKFLEGLRYKVDQSGPTSKRLAAQSEGVIADPSEDPAVQAIESSTGTAEGQHNSVFVKGKWRPMADRADFKAAMKYTKRSMLRLRFFDKRLPQWFSHREAMKKQGIKLEEGEDTPKTYRDTALGTLAETSAIAAWRVADNALTFLHPQMRYGPISWDVPEGGQIADGGIEFRDDLTVDVLDANGVVIGSRQVKAFKDISGPLINAGRAVQKAAHLFIVASRIFDVYNARSRAKTELKEAWAENEAAEAEAVASATAAPAPTDPTDTRPPSPTLPKDLVRSAPKYRKATLEFESDIDRAAYIVRDRKKRSDADKSFLRWLKANGVSEAEAVVLGNKINTRLKGLYEEQGNIVVRADVDANAPFAPKVAPIIDLATGQPIKLPHSKTKIERLENEFNIWNDAYENKVNPEKTVTVIIDGKKRVITRRFMPLHRHPNRKTGEMQDGVLATIKNMERDVKNGEQDAIIINNFKTEYGDFNYHQIEFLHKTGQITTAKKNRLQLLSYVPFYRDQGWAQAQPLWNANNEHSRGEMMIDRALEGSFEKIDSNMFGQIISNITSITRDGLWNIATQRTIRDELANGTAVLITKENEFGDGKRELDEQHFSDIEIRVKEEGVTKRYRVKDPLLAQSVMMIGFSPTQTIENFFGKVFSAGGTTLGVRNEKVVKGLTKLLTVPSNMLRELVTRSPPFIVKNILRDGMQASVTFGGGPIMTLKAIRNVFKPGLLEEAQRRGISQPIDYTPDSDQYGKKAEKFLRRSALDWNSPISFISSPWAALGHLAQKSEVVTRMAVYDAVMTETGNGDPTQGNATEAMYQAMEIMNYGRRGSSQLFSTLAAMAPFVNGRIQGLDVVYRTHMGSADAPGLYGKQFDDSPRGKLMRAGTAARRGLFISMGTLMYWLAVKDDEEYKNAREDEKNDWWLIPMGPGRTGIKIPIPFEVGILYKVVPEQIFRVLSEQEHDFRDMRDAVGRQVFDTLWLDLRPQAIRPMIDAISNRNAFTGDQIVPTWMNNTVAAPEQYNPYTSEVTRLIGQSLDKIPLLNNMDFLTSPMKLEYMLRQYGGTIGSYIMVLTDRLIREAGDKNIVGTPADFGFDSWDKMPFLGDLFSDPQRGGGYQESFYEMVEDIDMVVATLGQMEQRVARDYTDEDEYKEKHEALFIARRQVKHLEQRMDHWREDRDRLFTRNDLSDEDKRRYLYRMFETRDDMLEQMLKLMTDIRADRTLAEKLIGTEPG